MVNVISEAGQRLERYEKEILGVVEGWRSVTGGAALMSLRGVALLTAATLVAELGDLERFAMRAVDELPGTGPSEHTTRRRSQTGRDHQDGQRDARKAMIEAAWNNRGPAGSAHDAARQEGLPKAVTDAAWAAQRGCTKATYNILCRVGRKKSQGHPAGPGPRTLRLRLGHWPVVKPRAPKTYTSAPETC